MVPGLKFQAGSSSWKKKNMCCNFKYSIWAHFLIWTQVFSDALPCAWADPMMQSRPLMMTIDVRREWERVLFFTTFEFGIVSMGKILALVKNNQNFLQLLVLLHWIIIVHTHANLHKLSPLKLLISHNDKFG